MFPAQSTKQQIVVLHEYLVWIVAGFPTNTTADDRIVIEITENKSGLWAQAS
jgi:hypothetical protein